MGGMRYPAQYQTAPDAEDGPARRLSKFLYRTLLEPRAARGDDRRLEFVLNSVLVAVIGLTISCWALSWFEELRLASAYDGISLPFFAGTCAALLLLFALSRAGRFRIAAHGLVIALFGAATYVSLAYGCDLQEALLAYLLTILISALLFGSTYSFLVTGAISLTFLALWYLESGPATPLIRQVAAGEDHAAEFVMVFLAFAAICWFSNQERDAVLARARASEAALIRERDLLERKIEERTRELKESQLEHVSQLYRFAEFGRLSSGMFHDLMNPLNALVSNVSQLESRPSHLPEVKRYLERAIQASRRMSGFLNTVRRQIKPGTTTERFSLNRELEEAVDMLQYKARQEEVEVVCETGTELFTYGNPYLFHQVVVNLISNAIDAYDEVSRQEARLVSVVLRGADGSAVLTITDRGCGIDAEVLERIFDEFFTTKPEGKGIGVGLAATKRSVERELGGTITVMTEPGKGSSFTVTLPMRRKEATPESAHLPAIPIGEEVHG